MDKELEEIDKAIRKWWREVSDKAAEERMARLKPILERLEVKPDVVVTE